MAKHIKVSIEISGIDENAVRERAISALADVAKSKEFQHMGQALNGSILNMPNFSISVSTLEGRIQQAESHLLAMRRQLSDD